MLSAAGGKAAGSAIAETPSSVSTRTAWTDQSVRYFFIAVALPGGQETAEHAVCSVCMLCRMVAVACRTRATSRSKPSSEECRRDWLAGRTGVVFLLPLACSVLTCCRRVMCGLRSDCGCCSRPERRQVSCRRVRPEDDSGTNVLPPLSLRFPKARKPLPASDGPVAIVTDG